MSSAIAALIPELQPWARQLLALADSAGVVPRITSTLRTHSEQARLYTKFLNGNSAYPVAPPGQSAHEAGYAFDMVVNGIDNQYDLGQVWGQWGGIWHPSDNIHFEYPGFVPGISTSAAPSLGERFGQGILDIYNSPLSIFLPTAFTVKETKPAPSFVQDILRQLGF